MAELITACARASLGSNIGGVAACDCMGLSKSDYPAIIQGSGGVVGAGVHFVPCCLRPVFAAFFAQASISRAIAGGKSPRGPLVGPLPRLHRLPSP